MKLLLLAAAIVFSASVSFAQAAKFDIVTYSAPTGWAVEKEADSIRFSKESGGSYCVISLTRSVDGVGDSAKNFRLLWQGMAVDGLDVKVEPQMGKPGKKDGWDAEFGIAPFEKDGLKGAALLTTFTAGSGKVVSVLAITNADSFQSDIEAFVDSVKLPPVTFPPAAPPKAATVQQPAASRPLSEYTWSATQNRKHSATGDNAGYSTGRYTFNLNGTYNFSRVNFQYHTPKYYVESEDGTYQMNGNRITLRPSRSGFTVHQQKKEDPPIKSGKIALDATEYIFELTDVNNSPRLLLSPASGETKRDGSFNFYNNGELTRSYIYTATINGNIVYR